MNKPKLWTRDFLLVTIVNFMVAVNFYLLMVVISAYAMDHFGSSPSEAGLAASIFIIGSLVARLFSGTWMERIGRKKLLFIGLVFGVVMSIAYFGAKSLILLLVIRFLHGITFGIASTLAGAIVSNIIPKERFGEGIAYFMLSTTFATAIGPFLAMFMSQHGSFNMIFVACAVFAALSLLSILFLSVPELKLTEQQFEDLKGLKFSNFLEMKAIPISIICGLIYFCYSSVLSFFAAYSQEIHLVYAASFFFIVYAAIVLISRPIVGQLLDSQGENFIMYPVILIFMVGMLILSQAHHGYTLLLAGVFVGLGSGAVQSSCQAIAVKVAPFHRTGLANATFFMFSDIGLGIGPVVFGLFIPFIGYRGVYASTAVVAFACVFLYYLAHGKRFVHGVMEGN